VRPDKIISVSYIQKHMPPPPLSLYELSFDYTTVESEDIKIFSPTVTSLAELHPVLKVGPCVFLHR